MLRRIASNKPLALAVLFLVSLPLIFHDYLISPGRSSVAHIPAWAIEYDDIDFSADDLDVLLGQVSWLVRSFERKAVLDAPVSRELEWLDDARTALTDGRLLLEDRLSGAEALLARHGLEGPIKDSHEATASTMRSDLERAIEYVTELEGHGRTYDSLRGCPVGIPVFTVLAPYFMRVPSPLLGEHPMEAWTFPSTAAVAYFNRLKNRLF